MSECENAVENTIRNYQDRIAELERQTTELRRVCEDRAAFEYTGTAMMVIEADMTISMGNQKMAEITGYKKSDLDTPRKWTEYVLEEDIPRLAQFHALRRSDPRTAPTTYEFRVKHASGDILHVLANVNMVPGTTKSIVSLINITDRRRVEDELRRSEERFRELFEHANDIIYVHDLDGLFISANAAALSTYGYTREDLPSLNIKDIVEPAHLEKAMGKIKAKLDGTADGDAPYELLTRTRDNKPVWVEIRTRLIGGEGKPVAVQGIARDISARREDQEALARSELRFKDTAELLPAVICEITPDRRVTYVNQLGLQSFGYSAEEVRSGLKIDEVADASELERIAENFRDVFMGKLHGAYEYLMKHKDGTRRYYMLNSSPILHDGKPCGVRTCLLDVHEQKVAQQHLRESEERFRSLFAASPIGLALFTPDGKCVEANEAFCKQFLLDPKTPRASLFTIAELSPEQKTSLLNGTQVRYDCDAEQPGAAPSKTCLEWLITPLAVGEQKPGTLLAQVQDVTQKRLEQRRRLDEAQRAADDARRMLADMRRDMTQSFTFSNMVSRSPRMREMFDILPQIAETPATVLVCGESGTGKELIARALHELSGRKDKPFVAINCSALPDSLLESELFGYKAGAFTDAKKDKPGKFALAESGTIFLDEIGDISPSMQVKLLRVLQERTYEPLGATSPVRADVRVITATNRDLPTAVKEGKFREDLYYRIKVLQIKLPPLRDRLSDLPLLCEHFVQRFNARYSRTVRGVSQEALEVLLAHDFPGNIRELENSIEHAFVFCRTNTIEIEHLPSELRAPQPGGERGTIAAVRNFDELEKLYIESVLAETGGNKLKAARKLGVHKATLFRKIKRLGISGVSSGEDEE